MEQQVYLPLTAAQYLTTMQAEPPSFEGHQGQGIIEETCTQLLHGNQVILHGTIPRNYLVVPEYSIAVSYKHAMIRKRGVRIDMAALQSAIMTALSQGKALAPGQLSFYSEKLSRETTLEDTAYCVPMIDLRACDLTLVDSLETIGDIIDAIRKLPKPRQEKFLRIGYKQLTKDIAPHDPDAPRIPDHLSWLASDLRAPLADD